jgi:hypothetical protein
MTVLGEGGLSYQVGYKTPDNSLFYFFRFSLKDITENVHFIVDLPSLLIIYTPWSITYLLHHSSTVLFATLLYKPPPSTQHPKSAPSTPQTLLTTYLEKHIPRTRSSTPRKYVPTRRPKMKRLRKTLKTPHNL